MKTVTLSSPYMDWLSNNPILAMGILCAMFFAYAIVIESWK